MPRYQGPAFILRTWDLGESDLLVSFFEQGRGKLKGVARGAKRSKKRFGGLLSPFLLIQIEYFEKPGASLLRIEGGTLIHYYSSLYTDLGKLLVGCSLLEWMQRVLPDGEGALEFFHLLKQAYECLDREKEADSLLWIFIVKSLVLLGMQPQFRICIHCRRPLGTSGIFGFSVPQGGPVCGHCVRKGTVTQRIHSETLVLLQNWLTSPLGDAVSSEVPERFLQEAETVLDAFLFYHVTREFRSLRVLKELRKKQRGRKR